MAEYDLNLRDYTRILRKRKFIILFSTVMLGFFSLFFATLIKPIPLYNATASVKIEDSTTMAGLYIESVTYSDADTLETQSAIITSIPVIELVAKDMGLIDKELSREEIRDNPELLNIVLDIKGKISTLVEGETNIVNISVVSEDPKYSKTIANSTAKMYQLSNILEKNRRNIEAKKFIEKRLEKVGNRLNSAQKELKTLRQEKRFVTMDVHIAQTVRRLEVAEKKHNEVRKRLDETLLLTKNLKEQKALPKEKSEGFYAEKMNPIFSSLNTRLNDLRSKRDLLLLDFTIKHPETKRVDLEIDNTVENMLRSLSTEEKKLRDIVKVTTKEMKEQTAEYRSLPEIGFRLADIEMDIKNNQILFAELESKHQEVLIKDAEKIQEITIIRPALEPTIPVNPPTTAATTVVGTIIGFILGVVMAFVRETIDTSIGAIEDVEAFLGVPVVGIIPFMGAEEIVDTLLQKKDLEQPEEVLELNARLVSHFAPKSTMAESFRSMRTGIEFILNDRKLKSLSFTSTTMREGKTTITSNFAMTMAQIGKKILLVDGDMRKPMTNNMFGIEREPGLSDVILGNYNWDEVIKTDTDIMMGKMGMEDITTTAPGINNLNIITSGLIPPNSTELLSSEKMTEIISEMTEAYDIVLFDSTPVLPSTDAVILAAKVDAVVIVNQVGQIARGALKRAKVQLDTSKANIIGVVLNGLKPDTGREYKDYGYYGYSYSYGTEQEIPPWYKNLYNEWVPETVRNLIKKINWKNREDKSDLDEEVSTVPWYKKLFKASEKEKQLSTTEEVPTVDWHKKLFKTPETEQRLSTTEEDDLFLEKSWKKWLKITILVIMLTFIFFGMLWQFGIIKM
ncbi:MAG: polysaccharide biosynthesis tyrosine autokinase [Candidatus Scalindua sp.]|jgi:capsular exopolysaccharide synthesis family protein|nr:polysaccharide biosynthesis tyrosine autokinase [Candidatus Scalindua sp.]